MKSNQVWRVWFFGAITLMMIMYILPAIWIGVSIEHTTQSAVTKYSQPDPTYALLSVIEDPASSPRTKNKAVWALGQLGDYRSLYQLEKYYNDGECEQDQKACAYELRKALEYLHGRPNLYSWIWNLKYNS